MSLICFLYQAWGVHNEMNTGIIFLRSTPSAMALLEAWINRMREELTKLAAMSNDFVQWWTNDQTFFNEVMYIYIYIHVYIYIYIYIYISPSLCTYYMHTYICTYVCLWEGGVYMYACRVNP